MTSSVMESVPTPLGQLIADWGHHEWSHVQATLGRLAKVVKPRVDELSSEARKDLVEFALKAVAEHADMMRPWLLEVALDAGAPLLGRYIAFVIYRPPPCWPDAVADRLRNMQLRADRGARVDGCIVQDFLADAKRWREYGDSPARLADLVAARHETVSFLRVHSAHETPPPPPPPPKLSEIDWSVFERDIYVDLCKIDAPPLDDDDGMRALEHWLASPASGSPDIAPFWMREWQLKMYLPHHPRATARQLEVLATHPWPAHQGGIAEKLRKMQLLLDHGAPADGFCLADMRKISIVDRVRELELEAEPSFNLAPERVAEWRADYGATLLFLLARGAALSSAHELAADIVSMYPRTKVYLALASIADKPNDAEQMRALDAWLQKRKKAIDAWQLPRAWQLALWVRKLHSDKVPSLALLDVATRVHLACEGGVDEKLRKLRVLLDRGALPHLPVKHRGSLLSIIDHVRALDATADQLPPDVARRWHADLRATADFLERQ